MHILIIPSWYKTEESPMKGTFFEEQARALMNRGHKVGIIFPEFISYSSDKNSKNEYVLDNNIPTFYSSYKAVIPRNFAVNYHLFARSIYKTYLKYVSEHGRPDIMHAHTVFYGGIATNYISKKEKIPYVITEHFTPFITGGITNKYDWEIAKKIFNDSKVNIAVSKGFRELLCQKLRIDISRFQVVPNMVNQLFLNSTSNRIFEDKAPVFFTMSFLTERKNHKLMLDSFSIFLKKVPKAVFKIGGSGTISDSLIQYATELGIKNNVLFLGELKREEVVNEINSCDIFLLASQFETFGVVLIEALACGKPIVTTDSVGPRDVVTDFNGVISKSFEINDFYLAMMSVYENYNRYDNQIIVNDCVNRFSENVVMGLIETAYK